STNNIIVENGQLINFEPLIEISEFLKIGRMDNISFSNIRNTIEIKDNLIHIPEMKIESSAINVQASGTHGFDDTFEYHLSTRLSDILFQKAINANNQEFEIALDTEDKRTVFLVLYDRGEGLAVEFDEKKAFHKIKQDLKDKRTELKTLLNEEFGFFKKDTNVNIKQVDENVPTFRFEFEGPDASDSVKSDSIEKSRKLFRNRKNTKKKTDIDFVIDNSDF
ncbi:AsmA-like C-terminal region-containing protein, partial [Bacteroidota bacterium]